MKTIASEHCRQNEMCRISGCVHCNKYSIDCVCKPGFTRVGKDCVGECTHIIIYFEKIWFIYVKNHIHRMSSHSICIVYADSAALSLPEEYYAYCLYILL